MRTTLIGSVALLAALATPALAGPDPLVTDRRGDHPVGAGDIISADLTTRGPGRGALVVELTLAEPPSAVTAYAYSVSFKVRGCWFSAIYYASPAVTAPAFAGCRDENGSSQTMPEAAATTSGTTITWTVPLAGPVRRGAVAHDITARTTPSGLASGGTLDEHGDAAYAFEPYRIGG